jgi:hypothetical protein
MQLLNKESLLDFLLLCFFLSGLLLIIQIHKKILQKSNFLQKFCSLTVFFNLFLISTSVLFSPLFQKIQLEKSVFGFFFQNFLDSIFFSTIFSLLINLLAYFYYENILLKEKYESLNCNPKIDSLKLSSIVFLCIFSIFIVVDCFNEYIMNIFNLRMTFYHKFTGFYFGLFFLMSHYIALEGILKIMIYSPAKKLKDSFNMDFEFGIFQNTLINEELENNTDELQNLVERYKMTGKKLPRQDKERLNELINKQNLLVHRKNLTNQFVTKKAKIIHFFKRVLGIVLFSVQNLINLVLLVSFLIVHLRFFYHEDSLFNENCLEILQRIFQNFSFKYFGHEASICISMIIVKTIFFSLFSYFCKKTFFPSLQECKALPMREEDIESENEEEDGRKNMKFLKDLFFFCCFNLFIIMLICLMMPRYTLFLPDDVCTLNFWNQENFLVLNKKCKMTLIGEIYVRIMQRNEIKAICFVLNMLLILKGLYSMGKGFWKKKKR